MKVVFERTAEDLIYFNRYYWRTSPAMQRAYRLNFAGAPIMAALMAFLFRDEGWIPALAAGLGAMVFYSLFLVWFTRRNLSTGVRGLLAEGHQKGMLGPHEIEIDPEGITERGPQNESRQSWVGIERIAEDARYIFIFIQPMMAHVIPKAAFRDPELAQEFIAQARSFHSSAS